jgi:hypothetical protein
MKRSLLLILIVAVYAATAGIFWLTSVKTIIIYPDKDSYSWQSVPKANNGLSNNFEIASYNKPPYNMRGWIEFNINSIPSDAWVISAKVRLRVWYIGNTTGRMYGVYRLTQPWAENVVNWANQPNYTEAHHAEALVPPVVTGWVNGAWDGPPLWMEWDLTGIMSDWRSSVNNYGLVVRDTQEYASAFYTTQFFTHDQVPNESYYPRLVVTCVFPRNVAILGGVIVAEGFLIIALHRMKNGRSNALQSK